MLQVHESAAQSFPQLATPRRYMAFLHTYEQVYSKKKKKIEEKQKHLQAGVSKLNEAKEVVDKLKRKANEQSVVCISIQTYSIKEKGIDYGIDQHLTCKSFD